MMKSDIRFYFMSVLVVFLGMASAQAQQIDTLERFRKTHTILAGVRDNNLPFSTFTADGASGYSIDLCQKVLEQARKDLKISDLKLQYIPVTAANRIAKLKDGSIDIECGQTVNTRSRQADVSFTYTHFVAAEKLLYRKTQAIRDYGDLANKAVSVVKGTTAEKLFTQLRDTELRTMQIALFESNADAMKALETGKVAAFAQVDITLESQRVKSSLADKLEITANPLSVEPMALMLRKDDAAFRAIADKAVGGLLGSPDFPPTYNRWFNAGTLRIPMPSMLKECLVRPSRDAGVALGLGYTL